MTPHGCSAEVLELRLPLRAPECPRLPIIECVSVKAVRRRAAVVTGETTMAAATATATAAPALVLVSKRVVLDPLAGSGTGFQVEVLETMLTVTNADVALGTPLATAYSSVPSCMRTNVHAYEVTHCLQPYGSSAGIDSISCL